MSKSFDLPSESETRFTVNPDPDPIIEQPLNVVAILIDIIIARTTECIDDF